jgi:membrane protein implicated in regulation of membrane protease activity
VSKAIGLMLTIAGLVLAVWFARMLLEPGPAPLTSFVVAAIAVAMISVGLRYLLKARNKTPKGEPPEERLEGDKR